MVTVLNFKNIVDLPKWRPLATTPEIDTSFPTTNLICDFRNSEDRHPIMFVPNASSKFSGYNVKTDSWMRITGLSLCNATYAAGVMMPSQGPRGVLAAGSTTTDIVISTALPASVGSNMLANRGDGIGFKIRIIGNAAGSSGLTEERYIVANTGGGAGTTTPTITLDSPLSFTPIAGDGYEFLSGRVFIIGGTNGAGCWKYYDIATNSFSGNLATAGLPATTATPSFIGLDELYVPFDRNPGEGFLGILTATASGAASLTGQAVGGDASLLADEYRNFQIRIVQDIAIPTAVGQRRNITTHTAGPSPVYTVPAWTVTPSANALYVIENNGDRILLWMNGQTSTFTYQIASNAWSTVLFAVRPAAAAQGVFSCHAFGIEPDLGKNSRHSYIYSFRGGSALTTLDLFDIAGAATGLWTGAIDYLNIPVGYTGVIFGTSYTYDPATNQGRYLYINVVAGNIAPTNPPGQDYYRFDIKNRVMETYALRRYPSGSFGTDTSRMGYTVFIDGSTKLSFLVHFLNSVPGSTTQGGNLPMFGISIIN